MGVLSQNLAEWFGKFQQTSQTIQTREKLYLDELKKRGPQGADLEAQQRQNQVLA